MSQDQIIVFAIIFCAMAMFVWGKVRYDLVAIAALMASVLLGIVPAEKAFEGFGHAAVITVAAVLIISKALQNSGIVEVLVRLLAPTRKSVTLHVAASSALGATLSCVMNNVGALALMLPVTLRNAAIAKKSPSLFLIPISFASLLGGLVTLIGTPPNIVVASYREQVAGTPFSMFDFAPVGILVAVGGITFLTLVGWRLLPERVSAAEPSSSLRHVESYSLESSIPTGSPLIGTRVRDLESLGEGEISVLTIIRKGSRRLAPRATERFLEDDILIIQGDPAVVQTIADGKTLSRLGHQDESRQHAQSEDVALIEAIVMPNTPIEGRSMRGVRMHDRYGVNLLAVSRQGRPATARLKNTTFRSGDVLLLQGEEQAIDQALQTLGCLPLAGRGLSIRKSRMGGILPAAIFLSAIVLAAAGAVSVPIAFTCAVILLIATSTISLNEAYANIEWPVILLIGALVPVGEALHHTGGTELIALSLVQISGDAPLWFMVAAVILASMWLSDLVHNTPTAILMSPVAISVAQTLGASADAFLMSVAIGAASPYLTPIGHQSNTLVMAPGGYNFLDYGRVGLPMQILILCIATPSIVYFWT